MYFLYYASLYTISIQTGQVLQVAVVHICYLVHII